jgi:hypothetical protein
VTIGNDGSHVVATSRGSVRIIDTETWRVAASLDGFDGNAVVATTPDCKVAAAITVGSLTVLNAFGAPSVHTIATGSGDGYGDTVAAISRDGRLLARSSFETDAYVVEVRAAADLSRSLFTVRYNAPVHLCFDADGSRLAVCTEDNTLHVVDTESRIESVVRPIPLGYLHFQMFLPSGDLLCASSTGDAYVIPTDGSLEVVTLSGAGGVSAVAATPDGRTCVTGAANGYIRVWNLELATATRSAGITSAVVDPARDAVWATDTSDHVRLYDLADGTVLREHHLEGPLRLHAVQPDGSTIVLSRKPAALPEEVLVVDVATWSVLSRVTSPYEPWVVHSVLPCGDRWIIVLNAAICRLYTETGTSWPNASNSYFDARAAGRDAILVADARTIAVYEATGYKVREFSLPSHNMNAYAWQRNAVSGDGSVAVISYGGLLMLDLRTGETRVLQAGPPEWEALALDHNGSKLILSRDAQALVCRTSDMKVIQEFPRGTGHARLEISGAEGSPQVSLTTSAGDIVVQSLDGDTRWSCWLDAPLNWSILVAGTTVVGVDESQRLVVLDLQSGAAD